MAERLSFSVALATPIVLCPLFEIVIFLFVLELSDCCLLLLFLFVISGMDRMSFTSGANSSLVYVADKPAPPIVALLQGRRLYYQVCFSNSNPNSCAAVHLFSLFMTIHLQRGLVVEWNNEHSQCAIHSIETGRALAPAPHFDYARFPHIRLHLGAVVRFDAVLDTNVGFLSNIFN